MLLFFACAAGGSAYLIIGSYIAPAQHHNDRGVGWFGLAVFGTMFVGSIAMMAITLRKYELSEHSLRELSPLGVRTIFWSDIVAIDLGAGKADADATITLRGGSKRSIAFSQLANHAPELREALMMHTEAIREQELRQFDRTGGSVPMSPPSASIFGIGLVGVLMLFTTYVAYTSNVPGAGPLFYVMNGFLLLLLLLFVWALTRRFIWNDEGMGASSLFGKKWFLWSEITSAFDRDIRSKNGQSEIFTIIAGKNKVLLTAGMPDYAAIKQMVMERAGNSSIGAGEAERKKAKESEDKQAVVVMTVCIVLLLGIVGWLAGMSFQKQHTVNLLSAHGVSTIATVTGRECSCGDHLVRDVVYSFQAGGIPYTGEHSLPKGVAPLKIGDRVEVIYLPGNPSLNRLQMLMDTGGTWGSLLFLLAITAVYIGLIIYVLNKRLKARRLQQDSQSDG